MSADFDKFHFLKVCLKVSEVKIDFRKVSTELGISNGAAKNRYTRMIASDSIPSNPQNLKYLQTCYEVSDAKFDFNKIASELGISQGAARQRFVHLMLAASNDNGSAPVADTPAKAKRGRKTGASTSKKHDAESEGKEGIEIAEAVEKKVKRGRNTAAAPKKREREVGSDALHVGKKNAKCARKVVAATSEKDAKAEAEEGSDMLEVVEKKPKRGKARGKNPKAKA